MPLIWAAISAHGFGHAAQVVPVLNALGRSVPGLHVILRTGVPTSFFHDRLTIPWTLHSVQQDIGCVQQGPLKIDVPATWEAHRHFHTQWDERLTCEVRDLKAARPSVIIADTPYLACAAGRETGIPTIGVANFTWAEILKPYIMPHAASEQALVATIENHYGRADSALRIAPGLPLSPYKTVADIRPIAEPSRSQREEVREYLGLAAEERLVLVGFGGIPLTTLPWNAMHNMKGYRFIVDGVLPHAYSGIRQLSSMPFSFKTLLASVDVVMTKPGYGTVVEAVALDIPIVYVRRHNFADEQPLVDFMRRYGRSNELLLEDFLAGRWEMALSVSMETSSPASPPTCSGAQDAADYLARYF
ncbi:hypothetical protein W02_03290 [Nitrospira sp. KM1]|uniref:hypothetical protein n=1 Tax=Nitrospira sp. KM1 TaxID=1936990 RepID=UPI0013A76FA7|nr:hypothetical protein [Nitrospira sp. KM1]BCA53189.1 hypothetical protein W02_03290 [Nitrospira sp. KM1]